MTRLSPPAISRFAEVVSKQHRVDVGDYARLHAWSIEAPDQFWGAVWAFYGVVSSQPYTAVLDQPVMPGAEWFTGARLNYADQVLRHRALPGPAIVSIAEDGTRRELGWAELYLQVASFAALLRDLGVCAGDRVVGYLTNAEEAMVAFLASAAVGAVWAGCAPDYGAAAAADRLAQLEPKVLVAATAYRFGGRLHDRRDVVLELAERLDVATIVSVSREGIDLSAGDLTPRRHVTWANAVSSTTAELHVEQLPPDHPLWVLFSSGTTGIPKGIVHAHAGVVVTHLAMLGLQHDLGPGDTLFWYTTTNWMLWNVVVSALLLGATTIAYEGSPAHPDAGRLWQIAADEQVTVLGTSPGHLQHSETAGVRPGDELDLGSLIQIAVTGAPVAATLNAWVAEHVSPTIPVVSASGGTDVVGAFVGGAPTLPVTPGEISGAILGVAVAAFDAQGRAVRDEVGELVVTQPMPSMPLRFWDDPDGEKYRRAYFDVYPGVWRHGDWVTHTSRGTFVVHGRSDSTLNRNGVRIGSADLYQIVENVPEVAEALVLGVERADGSYRMPMFLVAAAGHDLTEATLDEIRTRLRVEGSPRHVPDEFHLVPALPHTKTGKKLEIPLKRILQGAAARDVVSAGAVDRPELIDYYVALAQEWDAESAP